MHSFCIRPGTCQVPNNNNLLFNKQKIRSRLLPNLSIKYTRVSRLKLKRESTPLRPPAVSCLPNGTTKKGKHNCNPLFSKTPPRNVATPLYFRCTPLGTISPRGTVLLPHFRGVSKATVSCYHDSPRLVMLERFNRTLPKIRAQTHTTTTIAI